MGYIRTETVPTQAQIEAARKMLQLSSCFGKEVCPVLPCACAETMAALTAAAEVENEEKEMAEIAKEYGLNPTGDFMNEKLVAATIERCARVAEGFSQRTKSSAWEWAAQEIAAAIRALKDG